MHQAKLECDLESLIRVLLAIMMYFFPSIFKLFHFNFRTGIIFVCLQVSIFLVIFFLASDFNSATRLIVSGKTL